MYKNSMEEAKNIYINIYCDTQLKDYMICHILQPETNNLNSWKHNKIGKRTNYSSFKLR